MLRRADTGSQSTVPAPDGTWRSQAAVEIEHAGLFAGTLAAKRDVEESLEHICDRFRTNIAPVAESLEPLPPGASLPEDAVRTIAQLCNGLIAQLEGMRRRTNGRTGDAATRRRLYEVLGPYLAGNPLLAECLRGRGSSAGYGIALDALYTPAPLYSAPLGGLFDHYLRDVWQYLVDRTDHLAQHLGELIRDAVARNRTLTVLAFAPGSCREWTELDWDLGRPAERWRRVDLLCADRDHRALEQAAARLARNRLIRRVDTVVTDAAELDGTLHSLHVPPLDLVYAAGPADLLADRPLCDLVQALCRHLRPGGQLVVTHTDAGRARLEVGEWFLGLASVRRSPDEFAAVLLHALRRAPGEPRLRLRRDPGGSTIFAVVNRSGPG